MNKKFIKPALIGLGVTVLVGAYSLANPKSTSADFDLAGLNQQVQQQQSELNNHEARITNLESNVGSIQQNTNTAPADSQVSVPTVPPQPTATQSTASPVTAQPVYSGPTLVDAEVYATPYQEPKGAGGYSANFYCKETLSDGTNPTYWIGDTYDAQSSQPSGLPTYSLDGVPDTCGGVIGAQPTIYPAKQLVDDNFIAPDPYAGY